MTTIINKSLRIAPCNQKSRLARDESFIVADPRKQLQEEIKRCESPPTFYGSKRNEDTNDDSSNSLRLSRDTRKTSLPSLSEREAQAGASAHLRQELRRKESPTSFYLDHKKDRPSKKIGNLRSSKDQRAVRLPSLEYRQSQDDSILVATRRLEQIVVNRAGSRETLPHRS